MTPERWQMVRGILQSAIELAPEERAAYLDQQCATDPSIRKDVDEYLSIDGKLDADFLESPAVQQIDWPSLSSTGAGLLAEGIRLGNYELHGLLGAGGMGQVYRARDLLLKREVAIKVVPNFHSSDPARLHRFKQEAEATAALNHPNILTIYQVGQHESTFYIVEELLQGDTLRERLKGGPLPLRTATDFGIQIARGLAAAHESGVIHRDLKPENVFVTRDGRIKILDFGLAKLAEVRRSGEPGVDKTSATQWTEPGLVLGTTAYMSPEQVRGSEIDPRSDIFALGAVLYEMMTGCLAFARTTAADTMAAILNEDPPLPQSGKNVPPGMQTVIHRCLEKRPERRFQSAQDLAFALEALSGSGPISFSTTFPRWRRRFALIAGALLVILAIGAALWWRRSPRITDRSEWVQLTRFPDSVTQPALSPDGHMVAFIRGYSTFLDPGQIYIKILPDGEPVQLTHDNLLKMSPAFSPDGSRVAYTTVDPRNWDTTVIPTLGGEPQPLLRNASGLTWIGPQHVLFTEIKNGIHMGIVAAQENRIGEHDVYVPEAEQWMAHRSYASPDGKWALVVEMDEDHLWLPCHLVPMDGSTKGRYVGPLGGGCIAAAWTPDGRWMYFTSDHGGVSHIWRQRFPDGRPEQITSGPTEEDGIAMAPDGRSFVTAVAVQNASLWVHDNKGERQVSLEGNANNPKFTPDGKKLFYLTVIKAPNQFAWYRNPGELRVADLESGRSEPLMPGFPVLEYDISPDSKLVVMSTTDPEGKTRLWVMPFDRSSQPVQIPNVEGASPKFGLDNDIFFRHLDGKTEFVYRVHPDGTGLGKASTAPVFLFNDVSPDGRWLLVWAPIGGNGPPSICLFPVNGGNPIQIGNLMWVSWPQDGRSVLINGYLFALKPGEVLPAIPTGGFHSLDEVGRLPGAQPMEAEAFGPSAGVYAFYKRTIQRNLYRIPIP